LNFINNIFNKNSFYQNVGKLLSVNIVVQIIAFALSTIISRLYDAKDFSHLAVFMSIAGFFVIFSTLRLEYAFILPKKDEDAKALVKHSFIVALIVSLVSFIFIVLFQEKINNYYKIDLSPIWWYLLPLFVFFNASFNILINYFNRKKNYNKQAISQGILGLSNPIIAIIIGSKQFVKFGLINSFFLANFLASLYMFPILIKDKVFKIKISFSEIIKKYYQFPLFVTPLALVNFISNNLPVFILTPAFGDIIIGLITMAIGKVLKPINLIGSSVYQVLSKNIVDDIHNKNKVTNKVLKLLKSQFLVGVGPFVILYVFAPDIFSFIWGKEWMQAGVYLKFLVPWLFMSYMNSTLTFIPNLFFKQKYALLLEIVHLFLRFTALIYGVVENDIYLAIGLYSLVGFIVLSFNLIWYLFILRNYDSKIIEK